MTTQSSSQQLLTQQITNLLALEQLLAKEKEILQHQDPNALSEITAQKNDLLMAIQSFDEQIQQNQQFLQDKSAGLCQRELNEIEHILARCKEQNQVNGQIITQSQMAVERMKNTLLDNHSKSSLTYDNKGKKSGGVSSLGIKA